MQLNFKSTFLVWMHICFTSIHAQDFHLTQIDRSLPYLNPAFVGAYRGYERITLLNRNQWIGTGTQFLTSYGMAEFTPGRKVAKEKAYAGIAPSFSNDVGGDSRMTQRSFGLNISGHLPLAKGHWLAAGLQTAIQQRSADFSELLYYSQWNGTTIDPNMASGEENDFVSFSFVDAGLGLAYRYEPNSRGELKNGQWALSTGLSFLHVNRPVLQYNTLSADRLYQKLVAYAQTSLGLNEVSTLKCNLAYIRQGTHQQAIFGALYRYQMRGASQITNEVSNRFLTMGLYFRSSAAVSPYFAIDFGAFDLGLSYDADFGRLSSAYRHSIEINMSYTFSKRSMFRGNRLY
jgi:type IX secretion system PorP/SprF family membrane protein